MNLQRGIISPPEDSEADKSKKKLESLRRKRDQDAYEYEHFNEKSVSLEKMPSLSVTKQTPLKASLNFNQENETFDI